MNKHYYEDISWQIADISITHLVEVVLKSPVETLFTDCTAEGLAPYASWLKPNFIDDNDQLLISIHAFLIRSEF